MTWRLQWEPTVLNSATGYLKEDLQGSTACCMRLINWRKTIDPRARAPGAWSTAVFGTGSGGFSVASTSGGKPSISNM